MEFFSKQVFIIPLPWIETEIFELRTRTVTQRRSVRPDGSTCFILFHHVLDLIFACEQIVLNIIDVVVCEKLLQAENRAAKESARLASRALLSLKRARSPQAKNQITKLSAIDCAPKAKRGQDLRGKLFSHSNTLFLHSPQCLSRCEYFDYLHFHSKWAGLY
jgi:hypothetical protein